MAIRQASENTAQYDQAQRQARGFPLFRGVRSFMGWGTLGLMLAGVLALAVPGVGFLAVLAVSTIAAAARAVQVTTNGFMARSQLRGAEADVQADGQKPTPENVGQRLREEGRGFGVMRALKEAINPAGVRGEDEPKKKKLHTWVNRREGERGLDALGVDLSPEMKTFIAERIQFEKDGRGRIDPMKFSLRLSAKEMNGEGVPEGLKEALKEIQGQHYRKFVEAYLPNHVAHRMEQLEELKQLEESKNKDFLTIGEEARLEELQAEVKSWGPKGRKEAEELASTLAKSYEKQFGKAEAPEIGYHNGQNSVTFRQNTLQSAAGNAMLSAAGSRPDLDKGRLESLREVYANGKAKDAGEGKASGPDAGSGKKSEERETAR